MKITVMVIIPMICFVTNLSISALLDTNEKVPDKKTAIPNFLMTSF